MLEIVLDTNIIVSCLIKRTISTEKIFEAIKTDTILLNISFPMLEEIITVLSRPNIRKLTRMNKKEIKGIIRLLVEKARNVQPRVELELCRDPADNKFLECAVSEKVDYIVSGDKDLLDLKEVRGIQIINLKEFVEKL